MTNPTESLVARLRRRADTMNGTQPVGASDGCGTMTLGYYSGGDRDLDREAAERLSTLEARAAVLEGALSNIACFSQTENLLWWQEAARVALMSATKDEADEIIEAATVFARRTGKRFIPDPEKLKVFREVARTALSNEPGK